MGDINRNYWVSLVQQLNAEGDFNDLLPRILKELCDFFDFGGGFVYQWDHTGRFNLNESCFKYENPGLPESIMLGEELGEDLYDRLSSVREVSFGYDGAKGELGERMAELLNANILVAVPVVDRKNSIIALVGMMDRRSHVRHKPEDLEFAYTVSRTLGTYVKMHILQQRLEDTHKALDSILNHMGIDVYVNDFDTHEILYVNESMAAPYGGVDEVMGGICWQEWYEGKSGECDFCPQKKLLDENGEPTKVYGWDYQRPFDGSWFRVLSAAFRWVDGRIAHVVSSVDITENKTNELIVRRLAEYDHLTGLPNRYLLTQYIESRLPVFKESGRDAYLLFFDLDGFKEVNDTFGHKIGDELLCAISRALQGDSLLKDHSYRYGGDEFIVLCENPANIGQVIDRLLGLFLRPWFLEDKEVRCGVSIGVSHFPYDDDTVARLLRKADLAMYVAKSRGRMQACFYNDGNYCSPEEYFRLHPERA